MRPAGETRESHRTRAFRALLSCYPAAFRDEYGREMTLVFVDRYRAAAGPVARGRLWFEALAGILAEAPKEHARQARHDLRYAWRTLRQHALVTAVMVVTLGLGIGANTALFSLLDAVALRSIVAVPNADHLFSVSDPAHAGSVPEDARLSGPMFDRLRQAAPAGVRVAAMSRGVARVYTRLDGESDTTPARLQLVSSSFFPVLGVSPVLGRALPDESGDETTTPAAVISDDYRQNRFGGRPDVVGRVLTINGTAFTIAGVGPRGFTGVWLETPVDIWVPLAMQSALKYSSSFSADGANLTRPWLPQANVWWLYVIVHSPPERAADATGALGAALTTTDGRRGRLVPFVRGFSQFRQRFSTPLAAMMVMAGIVLLVACANVANLLLARAAGRQRELGVRLALGASRTRLLQQLLTESVLLVAMALGAALAVAQWASGLLARAATAAANGVMPVAAPLDLRALAFAATVALVSVLVFGLVPAWRAARLDLLAALRSDTRGATGRSAGPARVLVVLQVALSLVLVTGAGLFVRSFHDLVRVDPGIDRAHVLSVGIDPRLAGVRSDELSAFSQRILDALDGLPGIRSASLAMCGLQNRCALEDPFIVEGYQPRPDESIAFSMNAVSPLYFSTVGMRIIAGRGLTAQDAANTPRVAVVNRTLATRYFPGGRAIGRRFGLGAPDIEIVGIVDDARALGDPGAPAMPSVFVPLADGPATPRWIDIRTAADPEDVIAAVRHAISGAAPGMPIESIVTADERLRSSLGRERMVAFLTSAFGLLALALAGFGLFGLLSYAVAQRTRELGVRLALGASRGRVLWSVVGDGLRLVGYGVLLGLPVVAIAGRIVSTLFVNVSSYHVATIAAAAVTLAAVGAACGLLPALRAARVDPVIALRQE